MNDLITILYHSAMQADSALSAACESIGTDRWDAKSHNNAIVEACYNAKVAADLALHLATVAMRDLTDANA